MTKTLEYEIPSQHQNEVPGKEDVMRPQPLEKGEWYRGSGKLENKVAIITGGDSGIGRSVALFFAKEGADISIVYYNEHADAAKAQSMVEETGRKCIITSGDVANPAFCKEAVARTLSEFGHLDILVNNAAVQFISDDIRTLSDEQLERTFKTNIFSYFYMVRESVKFLKQGSTIINTASVTAYRGSPRLLDYSATKGAIVAFTRSLAANLLPKGIRVNAVAPGPVWTPLVPSSFAADEVSEFGKRSPMHRPGQPEEVAPSYVFLASRDSSFMAGQVLHPNGGEVING